MKTSDNKDENAAFKQAKKTISGFCPNLEVRIICGLVVETGFGAGL